MASANNMNLDDFGDNGWLVERMQTRLATEPESVPPAWAQLLAHQDSAVQPQPLLATNPGAGAIGSTWQSTPEPEATPTEPVSTDQHTDAPSSALNAKAPRSSAPDAPRSGVLDAPRSGVSDAPRSGVPPVATVEPRDQRGDAPASPGAGGGLSADVPNPLVRPTGDATSPARRRLRGAAARTAEHMAASRDIPTATSVRSVPMKLAIDQRDTINNFLRRSRGGKVSFTHLIAYAMVQAMQAVPVMNSAFEQDEAGIGYVIEQPSVNLGIAIDLTSPDGEHRLLVPVIKGAESLNFAQFWAAYEELVSRTRTNQIGPDDLVGATCTITNPGGIGTVASRPRLMPGQGVILGVGAITYPGQFEGTSSHALAELGISKVTSLTSTYDHRIIQGIQSGEFLRRIHALLLGEHDFFDQIFEAMRIPYPPLRWAQDISTVKTSQTGKQARIRGLIQAYRAFGHLQADTDPLEYRQRTHPDLELSSQGLTLWDLDREFPVRWIGNQPEQVFKLRDLITLLRDSYCHTTGIEYMHLQDPEQRMWWQERVEQPHTPRPRADQLRILDQLSEAEVFETFLQTKYVGQTRFSLEGAESTIVVLSELCERAANEDLIEVCLGMPHRGRLNVLTNVVGKLYSQVFREFDNRAPEREDVSGDVKYHLGAEGSYTAASGKAVRVSLAANPSHLEAVNPVVEGIARAKIDRLSDPSSQAVLPVLLHGDAAFAGQGIVYETLQMSQLRAYRTGGTIHVVVNNQVGFTTAPADGRSSVYATDVAKTVQAPILHVNGDDPDACARAAELAFAFRQRFRKDVVIDLVCYRRRGHNEGDDPSLTQPQMYDLIEQKRSVRKIFTESLIGRGEISLEDAEQAVNRFRARLEEVFSNVRDPAVPRENHPYAIAPTYPIKQRSKAARPITAEAMEIIAGVYENLPAGFHVHPKVAPQLKRRAEAIRSGPIDWATAEILAFGSLLIARRQVRICGQDTRRGTFSQRFGAIVDRRSGEAWVPLKHLASDQGPFDIFDSLLNENASLGFEYGYSLAAPDALVCWEAQYGDFANGAQTIIDEFIVGGHTKWGQESGVVMLLPHGYEGAGPDHSSARIERYLQLCHDGNISVCQPSTPASYFHLLRTHALVSDHRPLIVATPKSMLRNRLAVSQPSDFVSGTWHPALPDTSIADPDRVRRVLLCSGKIRWDLITERERAGLSDEVAIISLERLYPLPDEGLAIALARYAHVQDYRWVQDEPANQGPLDFLNRELWTKVSQRLGRTIAPKALSRPAAEVPAIGSRASDVEAHRALLEQAVGD